MCCNFILVVQKIYTKDTSVRGRANCYSPVPVTARLSQKTAAWSVLKKPISGHHVQ